MTSELELKLKEIQGLSEKVSDNTFTRKTTGTHYKIGVGYAPSTRRPVQDILRWMRGVEELLETLIEEPEA